jgi:hypothetical protein
MIRNQSLHLLRRHVSDCSHHHARLGLGSQGCRVGSRLRRQLRQAKIQNLHSPVARDKNIFRLQVAVNDALVVRRCQSSRHLLCELGRLSRRQRTGIQPSTQGFAFQKLRDQIRRTFVLAKIMNRQNVGMIQRRYRPRLLLEPPQPFGVAGKRPRQNFDGHVAIQPRIAGAIHLTHASDAEQGLDLVRTELRSRRKHPRVTMIAMQPGWN